MRFFAVLFLSLGSVPAAWAADTIALAFDDLPGLVHGKNQHVSGARHLLSSAERRTGFLARSFLPSLEAQIGGESFTTGDHSGMSQPFWSLETRWNLYRGGRDTLEEGIRGSRVQGARAAYDQARLEELTKARRAFWKLVYQRELAILLREAASQNEANLSAANRKILAGLATETDRIEFEMYRVQLEQELARAILGTSDSERTLSVLVGKPAGTGVQTKQAVPHEHDDALLESELDPETHRDVARLRADQAVAANQRAQALRWWAPTVDAYAGYALHTFREREFPSRADRDETVAGVRLTFPLFDGLQSRNEGSALELEAGGFEAQANQTAQELGAHFQGARQELRLTHDLIHVSERSVEQAAKYLRRTQAEYVRGVKNSPDVFSATVKYVDLKRRYAEIRRDYQLAKSELLAILGR